MNKQTRLQEIDGFLAAYRNGWMSFDSAHVAALRRERAALVKAGAA